MVQQSCDPWQEDLWDLEDSRYVRSFPVDDRSNAPEEFFDRFGFIVFRDVLSASESAASVDAIFDMCERGSSGRFQRGDPSSWCHFPQDGMEKFGCPSRSPAMSEAMLRNRAHPQVHDVFARFLGDSDLLCNHDRVCLQRPTRGEHGLEKYTTDSNLHLDMNPWRYLQDTESARQSLDSLGYRSMGDFFKENNAVFASDGLQLQGVLNLADNFEEDGGFWCVPGFARTFEAVFTATAMPAKQADAPSLRFGQRNEGPVLALLQKLAMRVPMQAGSLVLWDQRTPHGACRNYSTRPRVAQFLKLFPRRLVTPERLLRRTTLLRREFRGLPRDLLQSRVFGLAYPNPLGPRLALPPADAEDVTRPSSQQPRATLIELQRETEDKQTSKRVGRWRRSTEDLVDPTAAPEHQRQLSPVKAGQSPECVGSRRGSRGGRSHWGHRKDKASHSADVAAAD